MQDLLTEEPLLKRQVRIHLNGLQTVTLLEGLEDGKYDCAMGGARRDEEKLSKKERFFSHMIIDNGSKNQRSELWNLFNGRKRVKLRGFPFQTDRMDVGNIFYTKKLNYLPCIFLMKEKL